MKMVALSALLTLLASEGAGQASALPELLKAKFELYKQLSSTAEDKWGYVHNKCDGATFTALYCIAKGKSRNDCPVYQAESLTSKGLWYRHALHDCFPKDSRSDNSPDVFTMLAHLFWHYRDLIEVENIVRYGEQHNWTMGRSKPGRERETVVWSDRMKYLYYELRQQLGGDRNPYIRPPFARRDDTHGYESHLEVNEILLYGLMHGKVSQRDMEYLKARIISEPLNAVYQAVYHRLSDKRYDDATEVLLNPGYFPPRALPGSVNYCTEYLFQRDHLRGDGVINPDWISCPNEQAKYSGTDLMWASCIMTPGCLRT